MKSNSIEISKHLKKNYLKKIFINKISSLNNIKNNSLIFLEEERLNADLLKKLNKSKTYIYNQLKNKI